MPERPRTAVGTVGERNREGKKAGREEKEDGGWWRW